MSISNTTTTTLPTWGLILIVIGSVVLVLALTALVVPIARRIRQKRESSRRSSNSLLKFSDETSAPSMGVGVGVGVGLRVRVDEESVSISDHTVSAGGAGGTGGTGTGRHRRAQTQDTIATKPLLAAETEREISRSEDEDGENSRIHLGQSRAAANEHGRLEEIGRANGNGEGLSEVGEGVEDNDVEEDHQPPRINGLEISYPTKLRKVKSHNNPNSPSTSHANGNGTSKTPFFSLPVVRSASEGGIAAIGDGNRKGKMSFKAPSTSRLFDYSSHNPVAAARFTKSDMEEGIVNPYTSARKSSSIPPPPPPPPQSNTSNSAIEVNIWADTPIHTPTTSAANSATPSPTHSPSLTPSSLRSSIDASALTSAFHGDTYGHGHGHAKSRPSTIASGSGSINRYPSISPSVASGGTGVSRGSVKSGDTIFSYASNLRSLANSVSGGGGGGVVVPGMEYASTSTSPFVNAFAPSFNNPTSPSPSTSASALASVSPSQYQYQYQYRNTIASSSVKAIVQKTPAMPVIPESFRTRPTSSAVAGAGGLQHSLGEDAFGRDRVGVQSIHGLKDIQWQPFQPPNETFPIPPLPSSSNSTQIQNQFQIGNNAAKSNKNKNNSNNDNDNDNNNRGRGAKKAHVRDTSDQRQVEHQVRVVSPKPSITGSIGFLNNDVTGGLSSKEGKTGTIKTDSVGTRTPPSEYYSLPSVDGDGSDRPFSMVSDVSGVVGLDRDERDVLHRRALRSARMQRVVGDDSGGFCSPQQQQQQQQQKQIPMTSLTYEPFLPPPYSEHSPRNSFVQSRPVGAGVPIGSNATSILPGSNSRTTLSRLQKREREPERTSSRIPSTYSTLSNATSFYSTVTTTTTSPPQLPTPPSSPFQLDLANMNMNMNMNVNVDVNASRVGVSVRNQNDRNRDGDRDSQSTLTVTPTQASRSTLMSLPPGYGRGSVSSR